MEYLMVVGLNGIQMKEKNLNKPNIAKALVSHSPKTT
jgi:hypothetical protein